MKFIDAQWIDVNIFLPGNSDWVIVRCVNNDYVNFFFMACFDLGCWEYFDDKDNNYENSMKVTHWMYPPDINDQG